MTTLSNFKVLTGKQVALDYPYGFVLRCEMHYEVEFSPKKGFRAVQTSTNPKKENKVFNKPKKSTYSTFVCIVELENGHFDFKHFKINGDDSAKRFINFITENEITFTPEQSKYLFDVLILNIIIAGAYAKDKKADYLQSCNLSAITELRKAGADFNEIKTVGFNPIKF